MTHAERIAAAVDAARPDVELAQARIKALLAEADLEVRALRAMGFAVDLRFPINPREDLSRTRVEVTLQVKL